MSFRIDLSVLSEQAESSRFALTVHSLDQTLSDWSLNFITDRFIIPESIDKATISQVGSYCTLSPQGHVLSPEQAYYCEFSVNTPPLRFHNDGIKDALLHCHQRQTAFAPEITTTQLLSAYTQRSTVPDVAPQELALIPKPLHCEYLLGQFKLSRQTPINSCSEASKAAAWLAEELQTLFAFKTDAQEAAQITLEDDSSLSDAEYRLNIDSQGVRLVASSHAGFIHACASLLQLIESESNKLDGSADLSLPMLTIQDKPRFGYRGMMLDCARHFHSLETIKRLINQLAHYKFNTFHWHLSDDEGWRIEIRAYPELTEIGAWRSRDSILQPQYSSLSEVHGGYYSQAEIKQVIEYAAARGVTVIPEIDIPGHCRAAIKSLPQLLVDPDDRSDYTSIQHYHDNVLSPALEGSYQFLDTVLEEVAELFPSKLIHIGADEVPNDVWTASPKCQALMAQHGYQNAKDLQGHLLRYVEQKLASLGKQMGGWEEVQHGNKVSSDTVVYSWVSEQAAMQAIQQGHEVVLQPAQTTYFDMTQDYAPEEPGVSWANVLPLQQVYQYQPLAELAEDDPKRQQIKGIQCALWSELVTTQERIDYMLFPRITALAEVCWSDASLCNWQDYCARLKAHLGFLTRQQINYRDPWA